MQHYIGVLLVFSCLYFSPHILASAMAFALSSLSSLNIKSELVSESESES
ncbi:hypothetical protein Hanom_Chr07g00654651 [Helianthus anomalus]